LHKLVILFLHSILNFLLLKIKFFIMKIQSSTIAEYNATYKDQHNKNLDHSIENLRERGVDAEHIIGKIANFQVAIPSWALGTGGTRFGRFPSGGEPRNLEEKIEDVGLLHALNQSSGAISLHIPWDIPDDYIAISNLAQSFGLKFDAVNSNTFQDQQDQVLSYKFGSLCHSDKEIRKLAVDHNKEVIDHGIKIGSKSITVWLADGSNFPGQQNFRKALSRTLDSLRSIYDHLPDDWQMFVEYKPFEPNFYSTVIPDWGTSFLLASKLGQKAYSLVDLGHHLPNTNIEQVVATLMGEHKLGGFHFNDSKFSDDDLTVGAIKPYQLYLIFNELVYGMEGENQEDAPLAWMIDASHNVKDPMEDLLQSVEAIKLAYAQALIIDRIKLEEVRENNDVVIAQEIMQDAYRTDVRSLLAEARIRNGAAYDPIGLFRQEKIRDQIIKERGLKTVATGL
jgi:L-rhamnose isomerase/sugar isomerase